MLRFPIVLELLLQAAEGIAHGHYARPRRVVMEIAAAEDATKLRTTGRLGSDAMFRYVPISNDAVTFYAMLMTSGLFFR